jgi:hypothetical protein
MAIPSLPSNWGVPGGPYYEAQDKVNWFKSNGVTTYDLLQAGWITPSEVYWFAERGMGDGSPPADQTSNNQPADTGGSSDYVDTSTPNPYEVEINFVSSMTGLPRDVIYQRLLSGETGFDIVYDYRDQQSQASSGSQPQPSTSTGLLGGSTSTGTTASGATSGNATTGSTTTSGSTTGSTTTSGSTTTGGSTGSSTTGPSYLDSSGNVIEQPRDKPQDAVTLMAAQLGLGLPKEWYAYGAQDRVNWFNANKITEQTLRDYKVPEADIAYAKQLGLGTKTAAPPSWSLPSGMTLPSDWASYTAGQKATWFNNNKVTADMLRAMGVPETDVQGAIAAGLGATTTTTPTTPTTPTFRPEDFLPPAYNLPATNFVPFATGGGQTSLAAPTTGFFYKTTPTPEVPFQFQSGAAGYTNLRPMTLEFGVPANVSQVQQFQPGPFNRSGLIANYDWAKTDAQLAQQAAQQAQQAADDAAQQTGSAKGGKVKSLLGPNPSNDDDGFGALQYGEFVIRKKAVNKYGEDFLEALNESRISKEKVKSLL